MKKFKTLVVSLALLVGAVAPITLQADTVLASTPQEQLCAGSGGEWNGNACVNNPNAGTTDLPAFIASIINILLFITGAIAVLMIIIGGIRYVISGGDQSAVTNAKNTILYAVVGLIVAIIAYAIVNFVVTYVA